VRGLNGMADWSSGQAFGLRTKEEPF
jgi:hypothetical protein